MVEIFRGKIIDVAKRSRDRRGHGLLGEDRGLRAHGPPVRPDRDGPHRRDRHLARARRDLTLTGCVRHAVPACRTAHLINLSPVTVGQLTPGGGLAVDAPALLAGAPSARSSRARRTGRPGPARPHRARRRRRRPERRRLRLARARARTGSASSSPTATASAIAALGVVARLTASGPDRFKRVAADWRELSADAVADAPDGPPGAGLVALGGFAFAPDGGHAPHWSGFDAADLIVPEVVARPPRRRRPADLGDLAAPDDTPEELAAPPGRPRRGAAPVAAAAARPVPGRPLPHRLRRTARALRGRRRAAPSSASARAPSRRSSSPARSPSTHRPPTTPPPSSASCGPASSPVTSSAPAAATPPSSPPHPSC